MKISISKAILAAGIFSLFAVSLTDARQRGGPQQPGAPPKLTKVRDIRTKMVAIQERVRSMNRERKSQDEISRQLMSEFGWGSGMASNNIAGMMREFQ